MTIQKKLQTLFWLLIAGAAAVMASAQLAGFAGECSFSNDEMLIYGASMLMVCYTLVTVPLSLRLFRFKWVETRLQTQYLRFAVVRLVMLGVGLLFNAACYGLFDQPSFFYMALITLVAMVFVYPSRQRSEEETHSADSK